MNRIVIVTQNGKVLRVIANSDLEYDIVDLDDRRRESGIAAELSQMEDSEDVDRVCREELLCEIESNDLNTYSEES